MNGQGYNDNRGSCWTSHWEVQNGIADAYQLSAAPGEPSASKATLQVQCVRKKKVMMKTFANHKATITKHILFYTKYPLIQG